MLPITRQQPMVGPALNYCDHENRHHAGGCIDVSCYRLWRQPGLRLLRHLNRGLDLVMAAIEGSRELAIVGWLAETWSLLI